MKPPKPNSWTTIGNCYNKKKPQTPKTGATIVIPEPGTDINMTVHHRNGAGQQASVPVPTYGLPIDANLAIYLLQNAISNSDAFLDVVTNRFIDFSTNKIKLNSRTLGIDDTLNLTYGVTFDKSIILKVLSQPGCEGIRCYLCARPGNPKHTSILIIGVDADGYDLNYKGYKNSKPGDLLKPDSDSDDVDTCSLIAEYGYPPDDPGIGNKTGSEATKTAKSDSHYVLLNLAKQGMKQL
jgi:hypothetical protein